jgi:hypothetical protein
MEIPFVGPSYNLESRPSGVQRTVNLIPHPQEPGNERTAWVFKDVPGLVLVTDFQAVATDTVLFLFHMTETATAEGVVELTGVSAAVDQTGASWVVSGGVALISEPTKFGVAALECSGDSHLDRDSDQSATGAPTEFAIGANTSLQASCWVYIDTAVAPPTYALTISIGSFVYPADPASFELQLIDGSASVAFDGSVLVLTDSVVIPEDQWVYLTMEHFNDGSGSYATTLWVDGVESGSIIEIDQSVFFAEINPINTISINSNASGIYVDECRAVLSETALPASFTPPAAPWPNP